MPLEAQAADKVRNSSMVYDDRGRLAARYDKIHLFGFEHGNESYRESRTIEPGCEVVTVESPFGRLGLSVCYDLRFPELYRAMQPVDLILEVVDQPQGQPVEQFGMRRLGAHQAKIARRGRQPYAKVPLPQPIRRHARRERICAVREPGGKSGPRLFH